MNYDKLPIDFGYPMYVELDNIFPWILSEWHKKRKMDIEEERESEKKKQERATEIASDLARMTKR